MEKRQISYSTFAAEAKASKTKQEKRRKKVAKLIDRTGGSSELWSGLEGKEYSNQSSRPQLESKGDLYRAVPGPLKRLAEH